MVSTATDDYRSSRELSAIARENQPFTLISTVRITDHAAQGRRRRTISTCVDPRPVGQLDAPYRFPLRLTHSKTTVRDGGGRENLRHRQVDDRDDTKAHTLTKLAMT